MICVKCGEQIPDESAFCLKCGAPVVDEAEATVTEGTESVPKSNVDGTALGGKEEKGAKIKRPTVIVAALIVIIVLFVAVTAYRKAQGLDINAGSVAITELYNPSLGIGLRLGMSKSVVDQKLGTPQSSGDDYLYKDTYLYVSYIDGELAHMYISWPNERWITKNGAAIGMTADELQQLLGKPDSIQHDDKWWYYRSGYRVIGFEIVRDSVMSIYIYDRTLVTE